MFEFTTTPNIMAKNSYLWGQPELCQLLSFMPGHLADESVTAHQSDRYYQTMTTCKQLVFLFYGVVMRCKSLNNLCKNLPLLEDKLTYPGINELAAVSTLSDANMNRNSEVFATLYGKLYGYSQPDLKPSLCHFRRIWIGHMIGSWQKDLAYGSAVRDTENLRIIFMAMAILGGFLSVAGIFSLSKLNVAKRVKEISVRKVLGSSLNQLLITINKSFLYVLAISLILGSVLGYLISDAVLGLLYKYYVDVSPLTSLVSGLFIGIVTTFILIVSVSTPAKANPAIGLRDD